MSGTVQVTENLGGKKTRLTLFGYLALVLNVSRSKFEMERAANSDRQKWARIIIDACRAYGELLHDVEVEDLEGRVALLEEHRNENDGKENQESGKLH